MNVLKLLQKAEVQKIVGKLVFFGLLGLLFVVNIFGSFKGMNTPEAMEAAALGYLMAQKPS